MDAAMRQLEQSSLANNAYLKGFATKVLSQASKVIESTQNLVNVHYASQIENINQCNCMMKMSDKLERDANSQSSVISSKNRLTVRIHDITSPNFELIAEICPPFFNFITLVKLSPSGRLLIVGNEYSQFFHVY
jgi:hypothetical protein